MAQRYELGQAADGTWLVRDRFTGSPATYDGELLDGLEMADADDLVDLLNAHDRKRPGDPQRWSPRATSGCGPIR